MKFPRLRRRRRERKAKRERFRKLFSRTEKRGYAKAAKREQRAYLKLGRLIRRMPLRTRALGVAETLVGVVEEGGNNQGKMVDRIIEADGGEIGEPWCGDFNAFCYRLAGSKAVTRAWAAVALLPGVSGVRRTRRPKPGDIVRYVFEHEGMFVRDNGDGTIDTIEGNTGTEGAVSDGDGRDGVHRRTRDKSLVEDYRRVMR